MRALHSAAARAAAVGDETIESLLGELALSFAQIRAKVLAMLSASA